MANRSEFLDFRREQIAQVVGSELRRMRREERVSTRTIAIALRQDIAYVQQIEDGGRDLLFVEFVTFASLVGDPEEVFGDIRRALSGLKRE